MFTTGNMVKVLNKLYFDLVMALKVNTKIMNGTFVFVTNSY